MALATLLTTLCISGLAIATWVSYNLCLHPLARYPGPWTWRAFRFCMLREMLTGRLPHCVRELHNRYGPVVRIAPDELSICLSQAWHDIYHRRDFHRPPQWRARPPGETADSLIQADAPTHARFRKALSPAFSEKAVRGYASSVTSHTDLLLTRLRARAGSSPIDLVKWINFCLFDITMDIGWGASFSLLKRENYHPWVVATQGFKELLIGVSLAYYQPLARLAECNMPAAARKGLDMILSIARQNVKQRLESQIDRKDIFANTLGKHQDLSAAGLTQDEMTANSLNYILAGSESVTTVLSAAFHHLLQNSDCLTVLSSEVRNAFNDPKEINGPTCQQRLPYLEAVLKESMRICPTVPDGMRREIPDEGGAVICGLALPKHTVVSVPTWTIFTSPDHWSEAREFRPERWLTAPAVEGSRSMQDFADDDRGAYYPFGYGPRNCIGITLGWEEMRVVLARFVFEFDITLPNGVTLRPWEEQEIYWVWEKRPLEVFLTPARKVL